MISNDRVQALIATDRDALIELMAAAYADGGMHHHWEVGMDPDITALMHEAKDRARGGGADYTAYQRWNAEMSTLVTTRKE